MKRDEVTKGSLSQTAVASMQLFTNLIDTLSHSFLIKGTSDFIF